MPRQNFMIDDDVSQLLERIDNKSSYICKLVRQRWQSWQHAHYVLTAAGWDGRTLLAVMDALNGTYLEGVESRGAQAISHELEDAERLEGICKKWNIDPAHWDRLIAAMRETPSLGHSEYLHILFEEFWAGNSHLERKLRGTGM